MSQLKLMLANLKMEDMGCGGEPPSPEEKAELYADYVRLVNATVGDAKPLPFESEWWPHEYFISHLKGWSTFSTNMIRWVG